jgi:KipI family sensor histidine kinase inhibitor
VVQLLAAGDHALLARTGSRPTPGLMPGPTPGAYRRALGLWQALTAARLPGVVDLVLAYASVLVHFDPLLTDSGALAEGIRAADAASRAASQAPGQGPGRARAPADRLITIPVRYGGADGPDLEEVAARLGLAPDALIRQHAHPRYPVYFLGFTAGFPYLGGLPAALAVPRLESPRTRVPAGSVGIAGRQTGIYPAATPGGWRLIGRTSARLFDPARTPPALLQPGDRVRFVPVADGDMPGAPAADAPAAQGQAATSAPAHTPDGASDGLAGVPWLRVVQPGSLTTVQDLGRPGYAAQGVAVGGAADRDALRLGNLLVGNPPGAAALEVTLGAAAFQALAPCVVAVAGADCAVRVAGRPLARLAPALVPAGARIELDRWRSGARAYLCVAGGVAVPPVLGSRATDLRAGMGGLAGRALAPGDELARGLTRAGLAALAARRLPAAALPADLADEMATLRVLPGPHAAAHPRDLALLLAWRFVVDPRADRMGLRLAPERAEAGDAPDVAGGEWGVVGGEVLSEGVPDGAVQLPPGGQPVLLLADHQTTGGYRIPAVVVSADLPRAGQLRPGARVRFALTTLSEALAALRAREAWFTELEARLAAAGSDGAGTEHVVAARLYGGFAEWSEEVDDDG